jgi:hypothetical protein
MAQARLGHGVEASECLRKAEASPEPQPQGSAGVDPLPWDQRVILLHLRREAEEVIREAQRASENSPGETPGWARSARLAEAIDG